MGGRCHCGNIMCYIEIEFEGKRRARREERREEEGERFERLSN